MCNDLILSIGEKFKAARKTKKLTLKQLSQQSGLSIGYLSNLENNVCSPTLENMQNICAVLGVSLMEILEGFQPQRLVVKKEERTTIFSIKNVVRYDSITYGDGKMDGLYITLFPKCNYDKSNWRHTYDEIGLVLSGSMDIRIDDEIFHLSEGDSFYINAYTNHSLSNPSDCMCESYWVKQGSK
ncbi:MAG: helix-turn-helix domain-containing protein [Eubacteriaceae bacterium]